MRGSKNLQSGALTGSRGFGSPYLTAAPDSDRATSCPLAGESVTDKLSSSFAIPVDRLSRTNLAHSLKTAPGLQVYPYKDTPAAVTHEFGLDSSMNIFFSLTWIICVSRDHINAYQSEAPFSFSQQFFQSSLLRVATAAFHMPAGANELVASGTDSLSRPLRRAGDENATVSGGMRKFGRPSSLETLSAKIWTALLD